MQRMRRARKDTVLVGVLKNERDRRLLLRKRWYRIPLSYAPKRPFQYLAFYQPANFGRRGKRIAWYARVVRATVRRRRALLPVEKNHPSAEAPYVQLRIGPVRALPRPIRNVVPRRVSFGFTTLRQLHTARDLLHLYGVAPTEQLVGAALAARGIPAVVQRTVSAGGRRYRLDFAIFCARGRVGIECDNTRAHAGRRQRRNDRAKDARLRRSGWTVLRLTEPDILADVDRCVAKVQRAVNSHGGPLFPARAPTTRP